jgi:two-component system sensor histidine kinase TctE
MRAFAAPALATLLAGGWVTYQVAEDVVSRAYDQNLLNLAKGVANRVAIDGDAVRLTLSFEAEAVLRTDTVDKIYFRVRDASGRIVAGDADLPLPEALVQDQRPRFYEAAYQDQEIRGVRLHTLQGGTDFYVTVAETRGKRRKAINELLLGFATALFLVLTAVAVVVRIGLPSGLAPLQRVQEKLAARSGHDLSPFDLAGVPVEVSEVMLALNAMLARLRDANAAQRQFLQDAAHQLRTPLANLQVQVELIRTGAPDPAALNRLHTSITRITRLTNQLLALARAEAGDRLMADASQVRLADLIDDMVEEWLRIADARNIDFGVQREPVTITGDPTLLRELIANLVDNALKYTPEGGRVTLRCTRTTNAVEIEVTDSGPGIPAERREEVFERFTRLPATAVSGSGLGLSIAREIVRAHDGNVWIEAGPGGIGTGLRVRLPIGPPNENARR